MAGSFLSLRGPGPCGWLSSDFKKTHCFLHFISFWLSQVDGNSSSWNFILTISRHPQGFKEVRTEHMWKALFYSFPYCSARGVDWPTFPCSGLALCLLPCPLSRLVPGSPFSNQPMCNHANDAPPLSQIIQAALNHSKICACMCVCMCM